PKPDLYYLPIMSSSDFVDVELFLYNNGHYETALNSSNARLNVFSPVIQGLYDYSQNKITKYEIDEIIYKSRNHDYRDDMDKYFYRNSINQKYHFSISKNTGNYEFRFSGGSDYV